MLRIVTGIIEIAEKNFSEADTVLQTYGNCVTSRNLDGSGSSIVVDCIDPEAFDQLRELGIISDGDFHQLPEIDIAKLIVE